MLKNLKNKYNIILGVIVGFILAQLVISEGYAILVSMQQKANIVGAEFPRQYVNILKGISVIIFIITVWLFNTKKSKKINFDRMSVYIILSLIFSIFIVMEILMVLGVIILPQYIKQIESNYFLSMNIGLVIIIIGVILFIVIFILLINKKVKYITFLIKEIKKIKDEGFGKTIEIKGNDELAELCKSINEMSLELSEKRDKEKAIEKVKNELITNMSHDLKTPLTAIIGYLELLNNKELDENLKKEYIQIAYSKSLRIKTLVNELFDYTNLNSPDIELKKVDFNIATLINQIVGESILGFYEKNIMVELDNPYEEIVCKVDVKLFTRVIENLVGNAEKYSDRNSIFKIKVIKNDEDVEINFINKCGHIKEKELDRIFEKFYRIDVSRNDRIEGTGLGLNIAKRIIELHNGMLEVEKEQEDIEFKIKIKQLYMV